MWTGLWTVTCRSCCIGIRKYCDAWFEYTSGSFQRLLRGGSEEFAFKTVDPAAVPQERVRPWRAFIAILGTKLGGMLSLFAVVIPHAARAGADESPRRAVDPG